MHLPPIGLTVLHRTRLTWQLAAKRWWRRKCDGTWLSGYTWARPLAATGPVWKLYPGAGANLSSGTDGRKTKEVCCGKSRAADEREQACAFDTENFRTSLRSVNLLYPGNGATTAVV